jgi:hypothetical protein
MSVFVAEWVLGESSQYGARTGVQERRKESTYYQNSMNKHAQNRVPYTCPEKLTSIP